MGHGLPELSLNLEMAGQTEIATFRFCEIGMIRLMRVVAAGAVPALERGVAHFADQLRFQIAVAGRAEIMLIAADQMFVLARMRTVTA
jgi:hypothetical protein